MDKTVEEVTKAETYGSKTVERTSYEYAGVGHAIKESSTNFAIILFMTLVYLGIATWRFLRMDLR